LNLLNLLSVFVIICWSFLIYTWIGYPLILFLLMRERLNRTSSQPESTGVLLVSKKNQFQSHVSSIENESYSRNTGNNLATAPIPCHFPTVSILLSAYNEEKHIDNRIRNLIELDYPQNKFSICIGIDGSTDRTAEIAKNWVSKIQGLRVYAFNQRRGKIAVLRELVAQNRNDILIFTDANTAFKPDALKKLVSHFQNPSVGGVCGRLLLLGEKEESFYWRMENHLKRMESSLDSCLGANGAIYAIRRHLFWSDIPDNTIVDDFVIGMKVREQRKRVLYETEAVAEENLPSTAEEWGRRIRIGAGDYQALMLCRKCLLPSYKKFAWMFLSHKVFRWFTPQILLTLFICSLALLVNYFFSGDSHFYLFEIVAIFGGSLMVIVFLSALIGRLLKNVTFSAGKILGFLRLCDHFFTMQVALFLGFIRFCRGNLRGYWKRTSRD